MESITEDNENGGNDGDNSDFREDDKEDIVGIEDEEENYEIEDTEGEHEDDDNNNEGESDNNIYEEDLIVDASMDINQMSIINEGTSYFETSTSALLFCWIQKHNICKFDFIIVNLLQNVKVIICFEYSNECI